MASQRKTVLIIGGTGAQGIPVVKSLTADSKYDVRVMTRNAKSAEAQTVAALPGVTIFEGDSYNEPDLRRAFVGVQYLFANTNGFVIGEKAEIYWGIRLYELAREFGLEHFVYAGLSYASKLGNFNPKYRTGHLDGKGKVGDYIASQPTAPMAWSVLSSCLYVENLSQMLRPHPDPQDPETLVFAVPLGDARLPLIYLDDYGKYARWMFDTPSRSNGLRLNVATEDISYKDLVAAFTEVTGKKAVYKDVSLDEYFSTGAFAQPEAKIGYTGVPDDPTLFTFRENFSGFWNCWKDELTKRDYKLLDEILPDRLKSVKQWMIESRYDGTSSAVLRRQF